MVKPLTEKERRREALAARQRANEALIETLGLERIKGESPSTAIRRYNRLVDDVHGAWLAEQEEY